jgi:hypothetical protein
MECAAYSIGAKHIALGRLVPLFLQSLSVTPVEPFIFMSIFFSEKLARQTYGGRAHLGL